MTPSGADEHLVFAEHPDVPEHWRSHERRRGVEESAAAGESTTAKSERFNRERTPPEAEAGPAERAATREGRGAAPLGTDEES